MSKWIARVEWATPDEYDEPSLDLVMDHLEGHDPAISAEPSTQPGSRTYAATVTIEANTLRQAISAALELVEGATGERASGIEVLDVDDFDHRALEPTIPELVGHAEVAELLGVSRQRAGQLAERPDFPAAVVVTKAGPLRTRAAVEGWARTWQRKSGRPAKAGA